MARRKAKKAHKGDDLLGVGALLFGAVCLVGFVFFMATRSERIQEDLFEEIENMPELNRQQCPFDRDLIQSTKIILFDFSDPLPEDLRDYPATLLDNMVAEMQDADRFDRFGLYTLNPLGDTPKSMGEFCVPVTMNQIPEDVRRTLWGRDPDEHANLPPRYAPFLDVFERLWENERALEQFMADSRAMLAGQGRSRQGNSRIIENIEEIVGIEIDHSGGRVNLVLLSDMLQNSPAYSHYRNTWEFDSYLASRRRALPDMERFVFDVYLVQSCQTLATSDRRILQGFWEEYFESAGASVNFRLLEIDAQACGGEQSSSEPRARQSTDAPARARDAPSRQAQPSEPVRRPRNQTTRTPTKASKPVGQETPKPTPAREASTAPTSAATTRNLPDCPPAEIIASRASPEYPRQARGNATLRYELQLDSRGAPIALNLYDMIVTYRQHEQAFQESAAEYIHQLRFRVHASSSCKGGQTTRVTVRF